MDCFGKANPTIIDLAEQLYSTNWNPIHMRGEILLNFELGNFLFVDIPFIIQVDAGSEEVCLGKPFIDLCDKLAMDNQILYLTKNQESRHVKFRYYVEDLPDDPTTSSIELLPDCYQLYSQQFKVFCSETTTIDPNSYGVIPVSVQYPSIRKNKCPSVKDEYILDPHPGLIENLELSVFPFFGKTQ